MKLWLLKAIESGGYDCANGFVVGANDALSARKVASEKHGDEGPNVWLSPWRSTCWELVPTEGVIMRDFKNG
jgi:hypothetical protein